MKAAHLLLLAFVCFACKEPRGRVDVDGELKATLYVMRNALDEYNKDHGRYPSTLQELVPKYLRKMPVDPVTKSSTTWQLITEETVQPSSDFTTATTATAVPRSVIIDVRSGAGAPYSNY